MTDLKTICQDIVFDEIEVGDEMWYVHDVEYEVFKKEKVLDDPYWKRTVTSKDKEGNRIKLNGIHWPMFDFLRERGRAFFANSNKGQS